LTVDVDKIALVAELLNVPLRAGEPAVTATIEAALDDIIARARRANAVRLLGDPALVDLSLGRDGWR
jgi:predicted nucleic acid-binding protein